MKHLKLLITCLAVLLLAACSSTKVTTTAYTPLEQLQEMIPESQLLDVGIVPLNPGIDQAEEDDPTLLPELRNAESRFFADHLASTVQQSAGWGAVRVIPSTNSVMDVYVEGTIVHSDGEVMAVDITVTDTSGVVWYTKPYKEVVGKYAYERRVHGRDPFQGLYNRIANDLLAYQSSLASGKAEQLRTISELRFAREFAPDAYQEHLSNDSNGTITVVSLPASNDPLLNRIRRIRERDYLFVDTLQEHYHTFAKRMEASYQEFRAQSYDEIIAVRKLKRESSTRTVAGIAAVLAGIAAAGGGSGSSQAAGVVAIGSGGMLIKSGLSKRQEAQIHIEALAEMGSSLEAEIEPHVIELEDRTITLTGTVDAQYDQWKTILHQIFEQERGEL